MVMASIAVMLAAAAAAGWLIRRVRQAASRWEHGSEPIAERVHRLQRLLLSVVGPSWLVAIAVGAGGSAAAHVLGRHASSAAHAWASAAVVVVTLAALAVLFAGGRSVRRALARTRDVPLRAPDRGKRVLAAVVLGLAYAAVLILGFALVPRHGAGHVVGRSLVYLVGLGVFASVLAPLAIVRFRTTRLPDGEQRERLERLADTMGVRVRDFRVFAGRSQKVANAAQMGTLPGLRYVLLTDYLMDDLTPDQLDAVVAHELGHARHHHIAVKLTAVCVVWGALEALYLVVGGSGKAGATLASVPVLIAIPVGMLLVQGLVGVRLETAADDVAAQAVGAKPLADALDTLGRLNDTKRDTGRGWALLTQHPALKERIERLNAEPDPHVDHSPQHAVRTARTGS